MDDPGARTAGDTATAVIVVAVVVQTVVHLVNRAVGGPEFLDVNDEGTPWAILSGLTITLAAVATAAAAVTRRAPRLFAVPLAGLLALLAVDEVFVVHERVAWRAVMWLGVSHDWDSVVWPLVYVPLTGSVLLLFVLIARPAAASTRRRILIGLGLLVAAVLAEIASAPFSTMETGDGLVHALEGAVEEACELAGWGLLAAAMLRLAAPPRTVERPEVDGVTTRAA